MPANRDYYQIFRTLFATRLTNKLREKGFISKRRINGVNGKKLANEIGVSLPMARKYINGQSLPSNLNLQKIAAWLDIEPFWLLYGDNYQTNTPLQNIDKELFMQIFNQLFPLLCNANLTQGKYMSIVVRGLDIYCHIAAMEKDKPKDKAVTLVVDFLKKNI